MEFEIVLLFLTLFIGLPWIVLHYITRWKTAATITTDDEALLEELYQLAKRLDDRMDTVERLVAADQPIEQEALTHSAAEDELQQLKMKRAALDAELKEASR